MTTCSATHRNLVAAFAAAAMVATACSDDPVADDVAAEVPTSEVTTTEVVETETSTDPPEEATPDESSSGDQIVVEAGDGATTSYVSSALGGVRFEAPESNVVLVAGDQILVTTEEEMQDDDGQGYASVGVASMLGSGAPLESVDKYLDAIRGAGVEVTELDMTIEVLGYELVGYRMTGGNDELLLFASDRLGAPMQSGFGPLVDTIEFIGDTPSGVLIATAADDASDAEAWLPALGTLVDSLEPIGPTLDTPLPPGETVEFADGGEPPAPAQESTDPESPPPLGEAFSAVDPGRYELLNFGLPVSVEVPDGWFVQPNFPGVVILTKADSIGPGDRDLVWINDIRELAPIAGGPLRAGDPLSIDDIETIIADPPSGITIDDVERSEVATPGGDSMPIVSFTVSVDPSATCSPDDPCDYALITSYGFVKQLLSTSTQRVWFFPEHPSGPSAMIAQAHLGSDFLTEATAVMATLELRQ